MALCWQARYHAWRTRPLAELGAGFRGLVERAEAYVEDSPLCRVGAGALEVQRAATGGVAPYVGPLHPLAGTVFETEACGSVREPPFLSAPNAHFRKYGEENENTATTEKEDGRFRLD